MKVNSVIFRNLTNGLNQDKLFIEGVIGDTIQATIELEDRRNDPVTGGNVGTAYFFTGHDNGDLLVTYSSSTPVSQNSSFEILIEHLDAGGTVVVNSATIDVAYGFTERLNNFYPDFANNTNTRFTFLSYTDEYGTQTLNTVFPPQQIPNLATGNFGAEYYVEFESRGGAASVIDEFRFFPNVIANSTDPYSGISNDSTIQTLTMPDTGYSTQFRINGINGSFNTTSAKAGIDYTIEPTITNAGTLYTIVHTFRLSPLQNDADFNGTTYTVPTYYNGLESIKYVFKVEAFSSGQLADTTEDNFISFPDGNVGYYDELYNGGDAFNFVAIDKPFEPNISNVQSYTVTLDATPTSAFAMVYAIPETLTNNVKYFDQTNFNLVATTINGNDVTFTIDYGSLGFVQGDLLSLSIKAIGASGTENVFVANEFLVDTVTGGGVDLEPVNSAITADYAITNHWNDNISIAFNHHHGFVEDYAVSEFKITKTGTDIDFVSFKIGVRGDSSPTLESFLIGNAQIPYLLNRPDFKIDDTYRGSIIVNRINQNELTFKYPFQIWRNWLGFSDLRVFIDVTYRKGGVTFTDSFESAEMINGQYDATLSNANEPRVLFTGFEIYDSGMNLLPQLPQGQIVTVRGTFEDNNLNDLQADVADLVGYIGINREGGNQSTYEITHTNFTRRSGSPFVTQPTIVKTAIDKGYIEAQLDVNAAFDLFNSRKLELSSRIDRVQEFVTPSYNLIIQDDPANEGSNVLGVVYTSNVPNGTVLTWEIVAPTNPFVGQDTDPTNDVDFTTGNLTINNNIGNFTFNTICDNLTEGDERFDIIIKDGGGNEVTRYSDWLLVDTCQAVELLYLNPSYGNTDASIVVIDNDNLDANRNVVTYQAGNELNPNAIVIDALDINPNAVRSYLAVNYDATNNVYVLPVGTVDNGLNTLGESGVAYYDASFAFIKHLESSDLDANPLNEQAPLNNATNSEARSKRIKYTTQAYVSGTDLYVLRPFKGDITVLNVTTAFNQVGTFDFSGAVNLRDTIFNINGGTQSGEFLFYNQAGRLAVNHFSINTDLNLLIMPTRSSGIYNDASGFYVFRLDNLVTDTANSFVGFYQLNNNSTKNSIQMDTDTIGGNSYVYYGDNPSSSIKQLDITPLGVNGVNVTYDANDKISNVLTTTNSYSVLNPGLGTNDFHGCFVDSTYVYLGHANQDRVFRALK